MKKIKRVIVAFFACIFVLAPNTINAQDEIKIGEQTWTTKNLDVAKFRNGDDIPEAKTYEEWKKAGKDEKPAWCYYDNKSSNGAKYGKLYNWWAVSDPRGLTPAGWHVPSNDEWDKMIDYLGGKKEAGGKLKSKSWEGGDNSTGMNILPCGFRLAKGPAGSGAVGAGEFGGMDAELFLWSSTPKNLYGLNSFRKTWILKTSCYVGGLLGGQFCSVRCIKD
jgi:uncharacterized protein (TIGR02145 family)